MHTGIISFCDCISFNVKSSDTKDIILNGLEKKYGIRILQKHWFALDDKQFEYINKIPHLVCARSNGNPYFLYFTKYEDVNQIMYIDKKVQPGYEKPRIILSKGQFDDEIFENTLIEGEMVKDNKKQWIFLINDILLYKGKYLKDVYLQERLKYVYEMLEKHYKSDDIMDVCQYQVKKYVPCNKQSIIDLLQFTEKLPYTNRGLYFMSQSMKYKPKLINFNDELIKSVFRKVKDNPEFIEKNNREQNKEIETSISISIPVLTQKEEINTEEIVLQDKEKLLWLKKTEQPDIYDLYEKDTALDKIGIACIPGLRTSKMLRAIFKDLNVATAICFLCEYNSVFNNWTPIKIIK